MFDYRYHALSLAAVLFALAVGLLIGVAIGDSSLVSSAKSGIVHDLSSELNGTRRKDEGLQAKLSEAEAFSAGLYPLAVHDLLLGRSVGLLFLGSSSDEVNGLARAAVDEAGASLATVAALREPLELPDLARLAAGTRFAPLAGSTSLLERFGELVGRELVKGGPDTGRDLLSREGSALLSAFDGQLTHLEGLIVMRDDPTTMTPQQSEATAALHSGLLAGVAAEGVPVVGVELTGTEPSQVPWYKGERISSVDDLDTQAGQAALAYALSGVAGAYGSKPTANSLLPSVAATTARP
jgi:hypothetical protein